MRPSAVLAVGLVVLLVAWIAPGTGGTPVARGPGDAGSAGVPAATSAPLVGTAAAPSTEVEIAPGFAAAADRPLLGPANASGSMEVAVGLEPQDAAGLVAYLTSLYTPGATLYHHYLDPTQLASRYGAAPGAISSALAYFRSFGLTASASPDGLLVDVGGPPAEVGAAFHTSFDRYGTGPESWVVSHPTPAELPASIPWTGALGLGNATPLLPASTAPSAIGAVAGPASTCPSVSSYAPCQVWGAYDDADLIANGTDGSGLTIGIVDAYDGQEPQSELASDLGGFDSEFGLASPTLDFLYPVATTTDLNDTDTGWAFEEALDLEWAHASAPGAAIDMTFSPNAGAGLYEAVDYLVAHDLVNVISLSWGEPDVGIFNAYEGPCTAACNASTDGSYAILSPVLEFAAAEGISVFAATGDCGAADGTSGVATNFPASDPYVTAVGGTDLTVSSTDGWEGETGWSGNATGASAPGCENQGGSGGGYSPFPRPAWQTGPGLSVGSTRATPDVSAVSVPGVIVVKDGSLYGVEGTSVATPIWAGIAAIAGQADGAPLGFLDPSLYAILRSSSYATDFHDITSGNNGYAAGVGWDPVTGIGSPVVGALVSALTRPAASPTTLAVDLNATVTGGDAPLDVTFFENASGGTGTYPIEGVYFGDGTAATTTTGETSHVYATPGVYAAQSYAWDSSGDVTQSIPIAIVVGGGSSLSVALNATDAAPAVGRSVALYANVTGGVAPYTYDYAFGDGTFLNGSSAAVVPHAYAVAGGYCAVVIVVDSADPPDGGESAPVALSVGGAAAPSCSIDRGVRTVAPIPGLAARDAPADFPALFRVAGGLGSFTEQWVSSDPYVAACGCAIFRAPGTYSVTVFVNATGTPSISASTSVVVADPLRAVYDAGPTTGAAPLAVDVRALVTGGVGANTTTWTLNGGLVATGTSATIDVSTSGEYWIVGHTEDLGDGNASEAILVDALTAASLPGITATVTPAVDVASATTVNFSAAVVGAAGTTAYAWTLFGGASSFAANASRTYDAPETGAAAVDLTGTVRATLASGDVLDADFDLHPFFAIEADGFVPAADALVMTDAPGPASGAPPLAWSGAATVSGPGALGVNWTFGNGATAVGTTGTATFSTLGQFTVIVEANDSFGDTAWDVHGVSVAVPPVALTASATPVAGTAPLPVAFAANATGGAPPYAYSWSFGDGSTGSGANATHTYATAGEFNATVTVTDVYGQQSERTLTVNVSAAPVSVPPTTPPVPLTALVLAAGAAVAVAVALAVLVARRRGRSTP